MQRNFIDSYLPIPLRKKNRVEIFPNILDADEEIVAGLNEKVREGWRNK